MNPVNTLRALGVAQVQQANSGHPGIVLGAAPMLHTLWMNHLNVYPQEPTWVNRDRFVLSAGHGSALYYAMLHLAGFGLTIDDLKAFHLSYTDYHYYCNIGSPYTIDEEALKYIDYDLDIKVFPDREFKVLDKFEYQRNAAAMGYSNELKRIIKYEMANLKRDIKTNAFPFVDQTVLDYWQQFLSQDR